MGFAKAGRDNVELLRCLPRLRAEALEGPYAAAPPLPPPSNPGNDTDSPSSWPLSRPHGGGPMLVGPSRKRFLGELTGRYEPGERDAATAAACVAAVAGGAALVRVHAVAAVRDALAVADAVWG